MQDKFKSVDGVGTESDSVVYTSLCIAMVKLHCG